MRIATVGVHVLDVHAIGVAGIPPGSDGQLVETIRLSPAGTAGGTAVVLARLGARVRSFGAVGDDAAATTLLGMLAAEGVDVTGLVAKPGVQTSASVIPVRPNGDRPAWHCVGANAAWTLDDLDRAVLDEVDHLHLGGPEFLGGAAAADLLADARSRGVVTSVDVLAGGDPGLLAWIGECLPHVDHLLPNDEQVRGFTGCDDLVEGAQQLVAAGVGCVAATQGAKGAVVVSAVDVVEVPAYPVEVVDTTGCGDAFSAGYLRGLALGYDVRAAADLGCATAAQVAQGLGTDAGRYDLAGVQAFARG